MGKSWRFGKNHRARHPASSACRLLAGAEGAHARRETARVHHAARRYRGMADGGNAQQAAMPVIE
jgi:hypothetical protein